VTLKDVSHHGYGLNLDELPKSGSEAAACGFRFYYTGRPCAQGHNSPRYTKAGGCVACNRVKNVKRLGVDESRAGVRAVKHHTRMLAHKAGLTTYESPDPCKSGHYKRWVSTNNCIQCDGEARRRHKISSRFSRIKKQYGLTRDAYMAMVERQSASCAICGHTPESHFSLHVDHCHSTGRVRGLLCSKCNQAIGLFSEDVSLMQKAMRYLA
jgi:hypothetical protein